VRTVSTGNFEGTIADMQKVVRQGLWSCSGCNDPDFFGWMVPIIRIQIPNFGPNERQEAGLIYDEIYSIHVLMYSTDVRQKILERH
jgi:hypothetical protein